MGFERDLKSKIANGTDVRVRTRCAAVPVAQVSVLCEILGERVTGGDSLADFRRGRDGGNALAGDNFYGGRFEPAHVQR